MAVTEFQVAYEGTAPADIAALNLPADGSEYVLLKIGAGNTIDAILKIVSLIPAIQAALASTTIWGKIFSLMALAGQFEAAQ